MSQRLLHILEWAIALAAYAYLAYRLAVYDDYASVGASLRAMGAAQWIALAACVLLMPVNMLLEAWRWQTLFNVPMYEGRRNISLREAQRQVYYSKLAGLITPWRLGEYPARALLVPDQTARVLSLGAVGSATMTAAVILLGVTGLFFCPPVVAQTGNGYLYALVAVTLVLGIGLACAPRWLRRYADNIRPRLLLVSLAQSVLRVLCWCLQLALILYAFGFCLSTLGETVFLLPIYFLLITVTPNIPVVEAGVRGAWALFLFGTPNAALAGVALWVINTLLPCLAYPFLRKK